MLNDINIENFIDEKNPLKATIVSEKGSFACRRAIGEGYYDSEKNRTYIAWNEKGMDIYLAYYDYAEKKWSTPELVWKCDLFGRWEYHDYITLIQGTNGEPLFIYHIHSNSSYMIKKDAVGTWQHTQISDDENAYPAPIVYKNTIYYFYSKNKEITYPYRPLRFMKSTDNGDTWSEPRDVVDSGKKTPDKVEEVYQSSVIFAPANKKFPDRFIISYTMWGGQKHAWCGKGAFCILFYPHNEKCYTPDGELIGDVVDFEKMSKSPRAYEGRISPFDEYRHSTYPPVPQYDGEGNPVLVYGVRDEKEKGLYYAVFKDGAWQTMCISNEMWNIKDAQRVGNRLDLVLPHGDKVVVLSKHDDEEEFKIQSVTKIPHANKSDSVPYLNFISGEKAENKLLIGTIHVDDIPGYCEGKWPVAVLGE